MSLGPFFKKQLTWAEKYTTAGADQARVKWWKERITELEKREAVELPAEPQLVGAGEGERKAS